MTSRVKEQIGWLECVRPRFDFVTDDNSNPERAWEKRSVSLYFCKVHLLLLLLLFISSRAMNAATAFSWPSSFTCRCRITKHDTRIKSAIKSLTTPRVESLKAKQNYSFLGGFFGWRNDVSNQTITSHEQVSTCVCENRPLHDDDAINLATPSMARNDQRNKWLAAGAKSLLCIIIDQTRSPTAVRSEKRKVSRLNWTKHFLCCCP